MNEKEFLNNGEYICAYCLNKNEDKLCDAYYRCCDEMNKLKTTYSDYLERQIEQLQQENQQLKEQMISLYQEFKLNNVSTATEHQMICMEKEIHKKEVSGLKEQIKELEQSKLVMIDYEDIQQQFKQRDEVIDEAIKFIKEETNSMSAGLGIKKSIHTYKLLDILQKYKGDSK